MAENQTKTPEGNNRNLIIGAIVVVGLLIIVVFALIFMARGSNQETAELPTATEVSIEAAATVASEDKTGETEEPVATIAEEPIEESTEEPEPTEEPTAEPTEDPPEALLPEPQEITFQAEDGQTLSGRYYPAEVEGAPLIILMHWAPGTMDDWNEIAFWLQNRGLNGSSPNVGQQTWLDPSWFPTLPEGKSYAVMTFNFRKGEREQMLLDAQAAFNAARGLQAVDPSQIVSFGASIGADGAPDGCVWHNENFGGSCLGALSLSPGSWLTAPYNEVVDKLGAESPPKPVWCFYATNDSKAMETCQSVSGDHYRMVEWQGGGWHGMELIDPARDPNALSLILEWLTLLGL
jgi:dienelactone hydrolase